MMKDFLLTPPVAFIIFMGIFSIVYVFLSIYSARGPDHPDKHLPYSGGQKLPPTVVRLSYETYFRLGLLFGITHVAVLVLATFTSGGGNAYVGILYLIGFSISAFVLVGDNKNSER